MFLLVKKMIHNYKIRIKNRRYDDYEFSNALTLNTVEPTLEICPIKNKLFNHDIININHETSEVKLLHSSVRSMKSMPGVLILKGNKRYGKVKRKFLYKCIPDDKRMPEFLVPYTFKKSFHGNTNNIYIVFKYKHWDKKHPYGEIVQVIGTVDDLSNFYEYQLYCKSLYASIQLFNKNTINALKQKTQEEFIEQMIKNTNSEDRTDRNIITIDSNRSTDFDDALGMIEDEDNYIFSIYISNVAIWLDTLNLWDSFSQRIATIYLPDRKRPMLPTILSEGLCSLNENNVRFAITLDIYIDKKTYEIKKYNFKNTHIIVKSNLRYENKESLQANSLYRNIFDVIIVLNKKYKYSDHIHSSHDIIAYSMILMNFYSAKEFQKNKTGIFRTSKIRKDVEYPDNISKEIKKFLTVWNSSGGSYCKYENFETHELLELDAYMHITSPIRRLVDLLGIIKLCSFLNLCNYSESANNFYEKWSNDESIAYINKTMRSIRKIQNDCSLLKICVENTELLRDTYEGFVFDKISRNDSLFQYMVYLPRLKLTNRITSREDKKNHMFHNFNLYIFLDEIRMKKKIRLAFCE